MSRDNNKKAKPPIREGGKKWDESKDARRDAEIADTAAKAFKGKGKDRRGGGSDKRGSQRGSNPESWYNKHPQEVQDAGQISYGTPLGGSFKPQMVPEHVGVNPIDFKVPGIVGISWIPAVGVTTDKTSPINRGAYTAYVDLRSKLKLSNDYDASDMMISLVAVDSALAFHEMLRRAYGTARIPAPPENKYFPKTLLEAQGFDPDDIMQHLADFRNYMNVFATQMYAYAMPQGMTFSDRHQWMSQNIYLDADSTKAQAFVFRPEFFWIYNNTVETGSQLEPLKWWSLNGAKHTYADVVAMGEQIINSLLGDEDIGNIMGDLKNAFGDSAFRHFQTTEESYTLVPVYNESVLEQITNIKFCGAYRESTMLITQNPTVNNGAIQFTPQFYESLPGNVGVGCHRHFSHAPFLNAHLETSPIDNIEKTRLMPVMGSYAGVEQTSWSGEQQVGFYNLMYSGTEIPTFFQLYQAPVDSSDSNVGLLMTNSIAVAPTATWSLLSILISDVLWLQAFDWCWGFEIYVNGTASASLSSVAWDIDKFTFVPIDNLKWMHYCALSSEFVVPFA